MPRRRYLFIAELAAHLFSSLFSRHDLVPTAFGAGALQVKDHGDDVLEYYGHGSMPLPSFFDPEFFLSILPCFTHRTSVCETTDRLPGQGVYLNDNQRITVSG
jgi:hypothetical protein